MLVLHHGNRLEALADGLVDLLRHPAAPPLVPEVVVVQNAGMARWVAMRLARALGVAANVRFPLPAAYVWDVFRRLLADVPPAAALEPARATWHLMALLATLEDAPRFAPLRRWLDGADERGRWELARRIADLFDQYLVHRPDWIRAWECGDDEGWQAELWRRLVARADPRHRVRLADEFARTLDAAAVARAGLPPRLALFGIPTLAPLHLDVFAALADHLDVHVFLLNPCREYWGDIVAERDLVRRAGAREPAALHLEVGNSLLASLGRQGRDFLDLVLARLERPAGREAERFVAPAGDGMLPAIQADLLALRERGTAAHPATPAAADDRSIQAHACHGPMREVEVLHDQLLALFEAHPDLRPADVVVMTPDVETYAPCVEAVFATAPPDRYIPFAIADRSVRAESPLVEVFFELLALPGGRYEATRLLAVLEHAAVRRRFELGEADLPAVRAWLRTSGIRWGIDAASRARLGLPAVAEHTWRFGLDRLLLGYALAGEDERLFAGLLPCEGVEGTEARALGRLARFAEAAFTLDRDLAAPRPVAAWADTLVALLDAFVAPGDDAEEAAAQAIRSALDAMRADAADAGFTAPVALDVVVAHLREALDAPRPSG